MSSRAEDSLAAFAPLKEPDMPLDVENYAEPEVAVAAAVVGAAASPSLRRAICRSVVYGLAGALIAFDKSSAVAQGIAKGVKSGVRSISPDGDAPAPAPAAPPHAPAQPPTSLADAEG
jgi:hypothetical protein